MPFQQVCFPRDSCWLHGTLKGFMGRSVSLGMCKKIRGIAESANLCIIILKGNISTIAPLLCSILCDQHQSVSKNF